MNDREEEPASSSDLLIGIVGPCAAGKSTLIDSLRQLGYNARDIAQEHSFIPDMWQRLTNPDMLIFLDASYPTSLQRRKLDWSEADWQEQQRRLSHAKEHADMYLETDQMTTEEVLQRVLEFINYRKSKLDE